MIKVLQKIKNTFAMSEQTNRNYKEKNDKLDSIKF